LVRICTILLHRFGKSSANLAPPPLPKQTNTVIIILATSTPCTATAVLLRSKFTCMR
ncbi:hypothetical protein L9F63_013821, partial [Diploptera punctata]